MLALLSNNIRSEGGLISLVAIPSYGYALIGESQPFQTAAIYALSFILFFVLFFFHKKRFIFLFIFMGSLVGLVATLSRSYIFALVITLVVIILINMFSQKNFQSGEGFSFFLLLSCLC